MKTQNEPAKIGRFTVHKDFHKNGNNHDDGPLAPFFSKLSIVSRTLNLATGDTEFVGISEWFDTIQLPLTDQCVPEYRIFIRYGGHAGYAKANVFVESMEGRLESGPLEKLHE